MIKNIDKINILKRNKIINIVNFIKNLNNENKNNIIDKIIIFGSSTRGDCTIDSDIDIYFITKCNIFDYNLYIISSKLDYVAKNICDIFYSCATNFDLVRNILKHGVEVYEY